MPGEKVFFFCNPTIRSTAMDTTKWLLAQLLIVIGLFPSGVMSKTIDQTLEELATEAEHIVVARISEIPDTKQQAEYGRTVHLAHLQIIERVKGPKSEKSLQVQFVPGLSNSPELKVNETRLFFIYAKDGSMHISGGYRGALKMEQHAITANIAEQPYSRPVSELIDEIKTKFK
jgi:hypothetical protein